MTFPAYCLDKENKKDFKYDTMSWNAVSKLNWACLKRRHVYVAVAVAEAVRPKILKFYNIIIL